MSVHAALTLRSNWVDSLPPSRPLSVLVVDDSAPDCHLLGAWLETSDADWQAAHDVSSALHALATCHFDVVVLDVDLGEGPSGLELLARLEGPLSRRELEVVLVSTLGRAPELIARAFTLGADRCLAKPIERGRFLDAMTDLARRRSGTPSTAPGPEDDPPSLPRAKTSSRPTRPNFPVVSGELAITGDVVPPAARDGAALPHSVGFDLVTGEDDAFHLVVLDVGEEPDVLDYARQTAREALGSGTRPCDVPAVLDRRLGSKVGFAVVSHEGEAGALTLVTRGMPPFVVVPPGQSPLVVAPSGAEPTKRVVLPHGGVLVGFTAGMIGTAVDIVTLVERLGATRFGGNLARATRAQLGAILAEARPALAHRDAAVVVVGRST